MRFVIAGFVIAGAIGLEIYLSRRAAGKLADTATARLRQLNRRMAEGTEYSS